MLKITKEHLAAAKAAGACSDGLRQYRPGSPVSDISLDHLKWIEEVLPDLAQQAAAQAVAEIPGMRGVPSLALVALLYGDGYGYGDGDARDIVPTISA